MLGCKVPPHIFQARSQDFEMGGVQDFKIPREWRAR
jgi:hypothetical protein